MQKMPRIVKYLVMAGIPAGLLYLGLKYGLPALGVNFTLPF